MIFKLPSSWRAWEGMGCRGMFWTLLFLRTKLWLQFRVHGNPALILSIPPKVSLLRSPFCAQLQSNWAVDWWLKLDRSPLSSLRISPSTLKVDRTGCFSFSGFYVSRTSALFAVSWPALISIYIHSLFITREKESEHSQPTKYSFGSYNLWHTVIVIHSYHQHLVAF